MEGKILNLCLILTSLIGYLEWGGGNSMFLLQGEIEVLSMLFTDPRSAAHPFTLLPLLGQILLIITLFQSVPGRWLTLVGLSCISVLLILMFVIGLMSFNYKTLLSTLPFLVVGILVIRYHRRRPTETR